MTSIDDIIKFLKELTGSAKISPTSDIFDDIGMVGDDFHEMIEKYSAQYSVDMTNYLWYFHTDEERQNFGALFFKPPYKQVTRIPVTPKMLAEFANQGKWDLQYPNYIISPKRYDILINKILGILIGAIVILLIVRKYLV
jgi:hypothetical protein